MAGKYIHDDRSQETSRYSQGGTKALNGIYLCPVKEYNKQFSKQERKVR